MERNVYHRLDELEGEHWWFCARRSILKSVIKRYAPRVDRLRLLEAGCGTGGNLQTLAELGSLEAFEIDEEARQIAGGKLAIDIKYGSLPDAVPYPPGGFDIVAAFDVIEHVEDDVASLASLGKQLSPGGRLIMTVPAMPWMWSHHDTSHHHYRRYTRSRLESVLNEAGLKPLTTTYFNTLLFPAIVAMRFGKRALGYGETRDDAMPSPYLNAILKNIFKLEEHIVGRVNLPVGVSLLAVAERRA